MLPTSKAAPYKRERSGWFMVAWFCLLVVCTPIHAGNGDGVGCKVKNTPVGIHVPYMKMKRVPANAQAPLPKYRFDQRTFRNRCDMLCVLFAIRNKYKPSFSVAVCSWIVLFPPVTT